MNTKIKILILILVCFGLSGCTLKLGNKEVSSDSGFYASYDKGETWIQKVEYLNIGPSRAFFKTAQTTFVKQDPNDSRAFYLGTLQDGLIYSFDGANSWQKTLTGKGVVNDVTVDSKSRCVLYAAVSNKIYKTEDCLRNWTQIYVDGINNQSVRSVVVDGYNTNKIYLATSDGRIFKSEDFGVSWTMIKTFSKMKIVKMMINPKDTRKIYISTDSDGVYKSDNEGADWKKITDNIDVGQNKSKKDIDDQKDLEFDLSKDDALIYASKYGIFYTQDGGNSWTFIKILSKPGAVNIYSIALNPKNPNEMYYTTSRNFYKSLDSGNQWITKTLPTTKTPIDMLVDYNSANNIFMAVKKIGS